ncbi:MAG: ATP-binding protein [Anaerolineae bacterium]
MALEAERGLDAWIAKFATSLHFQRLDTSSILHAALTQMAEVVGAAQGAAAILDEHNLPQHAALFGYQVEDEGEFWTTLISQGLMGFVMHGRRVVIVRNISTDPRWAGNPKVLTTACGSAIGIPLRTIDRQSLLGAVILIHPQIDYFTALKAQMLETAGEITGAAMQNAMEMQSLRDSESAFRDLYIQVEAEKNEHVRDEALRRDLSAMIYHDLRNPVQNIQTSLSGLNRVLANSERTVAHDLIDLALRSTAQITRMVKGLLDLERLEGGKAIVNRKVTSVEEMLTDAVNLVRPSLDYADQTMLFDIDANLPTVTIDADMIQRVVVNLVENAAKHTPNGGRVSVGAHLTEQGIRIDVIDTGAGIPPGLRDRVFDKFFRVRNQNAPTGFGLGLAFCRLAVEAHGGRIWVESEPDHGSTFAFTLPVEGYEASIETRRAPARTK